MKHEPARPRTTLTTETDPWAQVSMVERQIRLVAYTSAGDPARRDDVVMFAMWAGALQKAIHDANA